MSLQRRLPFGRLGVALFVAVLIGVPLAAPQFWVTLGNYIGLYSIVALAGFLPGSASPSGPPFHALVDATQPAVTRVFRRTAGTPVAGLAMLVLLSLDHLRLRAALAVARSFGQAVPA